MKPKTRSCSTVELKLMRTMFRKVYNKQDAARLLRYYCEFSVPSLRKAVDLAKSRVAGRWGKDRAKDFGFGALVAASSYVGDKVQLSSRPSKNYQDRALGSLAAMRRNARAAIKARSKGAAAPKAPKARKAKAAKPKARAAARKQPKSVMASIRSIARGLR